MREPSIDEMDHSRPTLPPGSSGIPWMKGPGQWQFRWHRLLFPAVFLVYLLQTGFGIRDYSNGAATVVGFVLLGGFCCCYIGALPARWSAHHTLYWVLYGGAFACFLGELPLAHQDAFPMCVYLSILGIALGARWAVPLSATLALAALGVPALIPSWHQGLDVGDALSIVLVSLAMWAFFGILMANQALTEARAEVAGLAAENERNRIARDLHDLLGHSLTTITVKAALAKRVSESDPARAAQEIGEVEELARRALTDVRSAVASYREMSLAGELATGREVLRAAGIEAQMVTPTDVVRPELQELFAWVAREGITNVVRHSRALHCSVTLGPDSIEIVDDGRGGSASSAQCGLIGLRERVAATGGTVDAGPIRGGGWRLLVSVLVGSSGGVADADPSAGDAFPPSDEPTTIEPVAAEARAHATTTPGSPPVPGPADESQPGSTTDDAVGVTVVTIRLLLADDQALIRSALGALLSLEDDFEVVAEIGRGDEVVDAVREHRPDVALLDIEMPGLDGLAATAALTRELPECRVLIVTTFGRAGYLRRAMEAGALGFVVKDAPPEQLADAVRRVAAGQRVVDPELAAATLAGGASPLTGRERDVLVAARDGATVGDIATKLFLSEGTVRNYLSAAISKTGTRNRTEAIREADRQGWL